MVFANDAKNIPWDSLFAFFPNYVNLNIPKS